MGKDAPPFIGRFCPKKQQNRAKPIRLRRGNYTSLILINMKKLNRILIYRIGNLGDIICSLPAMMAVRQNFPEAWIGLLTNKATGGDPDPEMILAGNNCFNEILTYNPEEIKDWGYLKKFARLLRSLKIDLFVYLSHQKNTTKRLIRDWCLFRTTISGKFIGFRLAKPSRTIMQNDVIIPEYPQEVVRLLSLLSPEIEVSDIEFCLPIKEEHIKKVDVFEQRYQLSKKYPIVAICPGGKFSTKHWNNENFARVASSLQAQLNARIILIGGSQEQDAGQLIQREGGKYIINLIGLTNYMDSAEVISRCNLLIANDCGAVHLAAAVKTPVVGIYSSRDYPGAWHPWGNYHTILRNDSLPCRFCLKIECDSKQCINSITPKQVLEASINYLK
jgi:ADP-heptose:LPS heptosyltransferase